MSTVKETENLKRLNFNKMMDSILDAISNDGQYELFKNSLLCDKDNQYRKQRKAFHVILQAFGIDEDSDIFKIKLVDCLEKCLIYGHIRRFAD